MHCLGVPVDHRLVDIIKRFEVLTFNETSSHTHILEKFGQGAKRDGQQISGSERNHGSNLALPATKGGVLISLLRPPRNQTYDNGFTADTAACRTTDAVAKLIAIATGGEMTIDDVSTFDTLPYSPEGAEEAELIKAAEYTFTEMVKAKEPDVVLCCYQGNSDNGFIRNLRSLGVGQVFDEPSLKISANCITTRVNAFHPSYAVNYQPTYSCFRRLLLLEFVQAFSLLSRDWEEESWMIDLRSQCMKVARQLSKEPKLDWHIATVNRWKAILAAVEQSFFSLDFFKPNGVGRHTQKHLIDSNLSWNCADAFLLLNTFKSCHGNPRIGEMLREYFESWCNDGCEPWRPRINNSQSNLAGYFELQCLPRPSGVSDYSMPEVRAFFLTFLMDINLSFSREAGNMHNYQSDIFALRDAFQRFSINLEKFARRRSRPSLSDQFKNMDINSP